MARMKLARVLALLVMLPAVAAGQTPATRPTNLAAEVAQLRREVERLQAELNQLRAALVSIGAITVTGEPFTPPTDHAPILTDRETEITKSTTQPSVFTPRK